MLAVVVAPLVVTAIALGACAAADTMSPSEEGAASRAPPIFTNGGTGRLRIHVTLAVMGGAQPGPELPPVLPRTIGAADQVEIQVLDPIAPETSIAQARTDQSGVVVLSVPAGHYWVMAPWGSSEADSFFGTPLGANLPNGTPVLAWMEATVTRDAMTEVSLSIVEQLV